MSLRKNVASQVVTFNLVNATTGAALTGASVTTKVALDGTQSSGAGTVTELGTGQYKYVPTQSETNGTSVGMSFTASNAVPVNLQMFTVGQDPTQTTYQADVAKWLGTAASTPTVAGVPNVNAKTWNDLTTVALPLIPTTAGRSLDVSATGEAGIDWANVGAPTTTLNLSGTTIKTATDLGGDTANITAIKAKTDNLPTDPADASDIAASFSTVNATLTTLSGYVDTEVAAIKAKTDNLPAAPAAVADIPSAATIAGAVYDEATSGHTTAGTYGDKFGAHLKAVLKAVIGAGSTTTAVVLNSSTGIDGAAPSSTDDFYNGRIIIFTSGALAGQATSISDYTGSSKTLTVVAVTSAPSAAVTAVIV